MELNRIPRHELRKLERIRSRAVDAHQLTQFVRRTPFDDRTLFDRFDMIEEKVYQGMRKLATLVPKAWPISAAGRAG